MSCFFSPNYLLGYSFEVVEEVVWWLSISKWVFYVYFFYEIRLYIFRLLWVIRLWKEVRHGLSKLFTRCIYLRSYLRQELHIHLKTTIFFRSVPTQKIVSLNAFWSFERIIILTIVLTFFNNARYIPEPFQLNVSSCSISNTFRRWKIISKTWLNYTPWRFHIRCQELRLCLTIYSQIGIRRGWQIKLIALSSLFFLYLFDSKAT